MTDAQRERIARLSARRGATATREARTIPDKAAPRRRKTHAAARSRAIAAGLGAATMFGIVTVLGLDHPFAGADATTPPPTAPPAAAPAAPPVQVVIHRVPTPSAPTPAVASLPSATAPAALPTEPDPGPSEPIQLTATPVVQTVTVTVPSQATTPRRSSTPSQQANTSAPAPAPAPPAATTSGSN